MLQQAFGCLGRGLTSGLNLAIIAQLNRLGGKGKMEKRE